MIDLLSTIGLVLVVSGGIAWIGGAVATGKRFVYTGIALAVAAPLLVVLLGRLAVFFRDPGRDALLTATAIVSGVALLVYIFGRRGPKETKLSLKRRVGPEE